MKRICMFILMILITSQYLFTEEVDKPSTQFEQVLLKKGILIVKEFNEFSVFEGIKGEIAILTDIDNNMKTFALRVSTTYYNSKYDYGETTAVFDAQEIESAIKSLEFMIKKYSSLPESTPYTEVIYKGNGGSSFGFYISEEKKKGFFKVSYKESVYFDIEKLVELKTFFDNAKKKIIEFGGTFS